jgi:hypothetical protein
VSAHLVALRERLSSWGKRATEKLKAKLWLYVLISFAVGQLKDGAQGAINDYLATRSGTVFDIVRSIFIALSPLGLAALVLALCVAGVVIHAYFDVRRQPLIEVPPERKQAPVSPEPLAVPENAERLLDLFKHWDQALGHAAHVMEREICSHGSSEEAQLLCFAIRAYPLELSKEKLIELRRKFEYFRPREATQSAFDALRAEMLQTLSLCNFLLVFWINKGGAMIRGEQLLSAPVYIGFYDAYREALEAARLLRYHSELGSLAKALLDLETKPTAPVDPPPSMASGQVPPPTPSAR